MALAIAALAACSSSTAPSPPRGPFQIHGVITRFVTGQAVSGATVSFEPAEGGAAVESTSDQAGVYSLLVPAAGNYVARIDGRLAGTVDVTGPTYRGDLLFDDMACRSRYGIVSDARTLRPVSGARVSLGDGVATSDAGGWYRIDLGCEPSFNYGTSFLTVTRRGYQDFQQVVGRGIFSVLRLDAALTPQIGR